MGKQCFLSDVVKRITNELEALHRAARQTFQLAERMSEQMFQREKQETATIANLRKTIEDLDHKLAVAQEKLDRGKTIRAMMHN